MAFETKLLLLTATLPFWDLQAETEPEIHVGELKIISQNEHRRLKREQFCQVLCLPNWFLYNYTCYRASTATRTWIQSELHCQQLVPGGHLASLHSLETNRFLVTLARNKLSSYVTWVGASDKYKLGTFFWTDGSPWDYSNWKHYPAVNDVHYCVELNIRHVDIYKMEIKYCSERKHFICQYKPDFP
ncbi:lectin-like [Hemiscyllium ocellatum]|uniref:lectin-like n=1 Tax=Hemiscyllium ocellatum TaxID=170820 RepID=UPI0029674079|nr:lectin-like [Hemiscyllium ocellatum]